VQSVNHRQQQQQQQQQQHGVGLRVESCSRKTWPALLGKQTSVKQLQSEASTVYDIQWQGLPAHHAADAVAHVATVSAPTASSASGSSSASTTQIMC
jgi:hypothetical protein